MIKVISPIDDTPAQKAGIKPGDYILMINNEQLIDIPIEEAIQKMRGKKGTSLTLTVVNEKDKKQRKLTIKRAVIKIKKVNCCMKILATFGLLTFKNERAIKLPEPLGSCIDVPMANLQD